ncbi:MAG: right-handed parallel beta-helix repeat-containing protein [Bacteroidetes bacterium]|nr:right-handed parallel beta-helix repeat-containing protein [Bacteroidota bacterium]
MRRIRTRAWILLIVWALLGSTDALLAQTIYYVSPSGHDGADGRSPERAFRTIGKAATVAGPGDTVILLPGVYREVLFPRRSGRPGAPITFRARRLGEVVVTSLEVATGWQLYRGRIYRCPVLPPWEGWEPRQVFENLQPLQRRADLGALNGPGQWAYQNGYLYVRTFDDSHPDTKQIEYDSRDCVVSDGGYRHHIVIENLILRGSNGPAAYEDNRGTVLIWHSSYWTFRNLIIEKSHSDGFVWAYEGQRGLVVEDVVIRDVGMRGMLLQANESRKHVGIILRRLTVTRAKDVGILIRNAENVLIEDLEVSHCGAGGVNLVRTRQVQVQRAIAHHNALLRDDESGFSTFEDVEDVTYSDCVSFSNGIGRDPAVRTRYGAWGFFADRFSRRIQYVRCIAFDNLSAGFQALDAQEVEYLHCTSWGNNTHLPTLMAEFASGWFVNDIPQDNAPTTVRLTNCLAVSTTQTPALKVYGEARSGFRSDYNLWWRADGGPVVRWHESDLSWQAYQAISGQDLHSRYVDPALRPFLVGRNGLSEWQSAFEPPPNSPALDAGRDVGLPYYGAAPDLGAIEVLGTSTLLSRITLEVSRQDDTTAVIRWRVQTDVRFSHLLIERARDQEPFFPVARLRFEPEGRYLDPVPARARIHYRIRLEMGPGQSIYSESRELASVIPTGWSRQSELAVTPNPAFFPNPARNTITVRLQLARTARVQLLLYDVLGRLVGRFLEGTYEAGAHEIRCSPKGLPAGWYLALLLVDGRPSKQQPLLWLGRP